MLPRSALPIVLGPPRFQSASGAALPSHGFVVQTVQSSGRARVCPVGFSGSHHETSCTRPNVGAVRGVGGDTVCNPQSRFVGLTAAAVDLAVSPSKDRSRGGVAPDHPLETCVPSALGAKRRWGSLLGIPRPRRARRRLDLHLCRGSSSSPASHFFSLCNCM